MSFRKTLIGIAGAASLFLSSEANRSYAQQAPRNEQEKAQVERELKEKYAHKIIEPHKIETIYQPSQGSDIFLPAASLGFYLFIKKISGGRKNEREI